MSVRDETPDDWKSYNEFADGIGTNRLAPSTELDGSQLRIEDGHGVITLNVDGAEVAWGWTRRDGEELNGRAVADIVKVAPETFFIDLWLNDHSERDALTAIVDRDRGHTLTVHTHVRELGVAGEPLVTQSFEPGRLSGINQTGPAPEITSELLGKRGFSVYSPNHAYEHVYLNSQRYTWQCLRGVQRGHGDTDLASYWKFADNQYVFAFREFRIPVASVMFLNAGERTSTGKFLGIQDDGSVQNGKAGANFEIISSTQYPAGYEPV